MITVQFNHQVKNFEEWFPFFKEHASFRQAAGCQGAEVFTDPNDRNNVTVLLTWENAETAQKFAGSSELKEVMKKAGVLSAPKATILNNEGKLAG
ncbi:antibiotic biosynthesis monooxygenase [bacterium]|nr:antibiotic biosynthesis monooxygenase [bacterium]MBU1637299.1 antibiotic biosynthesis monooxygenase [bacterium]MBU1920797.1 antibiotic biosynthesis monooxygenase [bacterium]